MPNYHFEKIDWKVTRENQKFADGTDAVAMKAKNYD